MQAEQWRIRKPAIHGRRGMVVAQHWQAAEAGAGLLRAGGNALDAAVGAAFALNAVEPWMSGLGGNGYLVYWAAAGGRAHALNFQGVVPAALDPADYPVDPAAPTTLMDYPGVVGNRNLYGCGAIAVPGAVAGLGAAQQRFGRLGFDRVLTPAIDLADAGLPVDWHATLQIALHMATLRHDPSARALYLPDGCPPQPDTRLALGALPRTLRRLAECGSEEFYRGALAERLVADLQAGGSAIGPQDLADYRVHWHEPLHGTHRGTTVHGADRSSGAPRLLEMLAWVQRELTPAAVPDTTTYRIYAAALNAAFAAHRRRAEPTGCTSHLCAVDAEGNMAALTCTLLERFGSQVVLPGTGIV
ncbi:MAG: gamma-glutamyltransferase, partial [Candidatus Competibacterales bacterium]|nr:gamma-glutamyltransferase [Candidatus Competibacterales bacterium]